MRDHCCGCCYWERPYEMVSTEEHTWTVTWGRCGRTRIDFDDSRWDDDSLAWAGHEDSTEGPAWLNTQPNFGCTQWRAK